MKQSEKQKIIDNLNNKGFLNGTSKKSLKVLDEELAAEMDLKLKNKIKKFKEDLDSFAINFCS